MGGWGAPALALGTWLVRQRQPLSEAFLKPPALPVVFTILEATAYGRGFDKALPFRHGSPVVRGWPYYE